MIPINWILEPISTHLPEIEELFKKTIGHRHELNYTQNPLFNETKFSRMGYVDRKLIYYSAGIERPEYNGSIRIMSRHTRDRNFDFGTLSDDLARGLETLDQSAQYAALLGYTDIWVSREENPKILEYFAKNSNYNWTVTLENIPRGGKQYVLRLV